MLGARQLICQSERDGEDEDVGVYVCMSMCVSVPMCVSVSMCVCVCQCPERLGSCPVPEYTWRQKQKDPTAFSFFLFLKLFVHFREMIYFYQDCPGFSPSIKSLNFQEHTKSLAHFVLY